MKYIKWVVGILAVVGVAILSIITLNKFNTSKLFTSINEYFFLKSKGYKRKDNTIISDEGDEVDIPEPLQDKPIEGAGDTPQKDLEITGENILHEVVDRRNVTPIENSFKKKVDKEE